MSSGRIVVDLVDEITKLIDRVGAGGTLNATDGDVLVRARLSILRNREVIKRLRQQVEGDDR